MIEFKGTTSWYPDLNIEPKAIQIIPPSHKTLQWCKSFDLLKNNIFIFTVAGAVLDFHQLPKALS